MTQRLKTNPNGLSQEIPPPFFSGLIPVTLITKSALIVIVFANYEISPNSECLIFGLARNPNFIINIFIARCLLSRPNLQY
jgi:hypothetical protein